MKNTVTVNERNKWHSSSGRSLIETLLVIAIASLLAAVTLPQIISARRLIRSASLPREIATQLRFARQQAMSQRQAFTFVYDNSTKQISIVDHQATGPALLTATGYPNTTGSNTILTVPLTGSGGLNSADLVFGVPSTITSTTLTDTSSPTALASGKLTITFQPDGTVVDVNGNTVNRTLFFYNNKAPDETACAISVLGAAGRIKVWRYNRSASQFAE